MRRWLTGALCAAGVLGTVLAGAGCGAEQADASRLVAPSPTRAPAEVVGGACQLLDYDVVQQQLGVRFDIAASGNVNATYTCVLQPAKGGVPDLSLSVTPTQVDSTTFKNRVSPKGSATVTELGKIAYSASITAANGFGPGVEVGWLSGNQRLMILRYRSPDGTAGDDVNRMVPKVVALAKAIDLASA